MITTWKVCMNFNFYINGLRVVKIETKSNKKIHVFFSGKTNLVRIWMNIAYSYDNDGDGVKRGRTV
jgi:hypothetical protein